MIHCFSVRLYKRRNGCVLTDVVQSLGSLFHIFILKFNRAAYQRGGGRGGGESAAFFFKDVSSNGKRKLEM